MAVVHEDGQCWSLANAFEKPVYTAGRKGLVQASVEALDAYWKKLTGFYGGLAKPVVACLDGEEGLDSLKGTGWSCSTGGQRRCSNRSHRNSAMNTLLLRLVAPMQSWGVESHFTVRDTGLEPSKSGVIGLICAALGRPRQAPLGDLNSLRMGVRVDREGTLRSDFQIAQNVLASDGKNVKSSVISNRYYLSDAAFLVGLEHADLALLEGIYCALQQPVWAVFLGRKAFMPSAPVWLPDGLRQRNPWKPLLKVMGGSIPGLTARPHPKCAW